MRAVAVLAAALVLAGCVAPAVREPAPTPVAPPPVAITAPPRPLAALLAQAPDLSRFRALAAAGGLDRLLAGRGAVTMLAPTDAAFARLPAGTVEALLQPGNRPSLLHLLRFWVVPGTATLPLADDTPVRLATLDGEAVTAVPGSGTTLLVDGSGRRGYTIGLTRASDGVLVQLNGIVAPQSIEPGGGRVSPASLPPREPAYPRSP